MSKYTTQLRWYIENQSQDQIDISIRERIELGRTKLFDFDYPIFNSDYKKVFETNFIRKFYMREVGFETIGLFKFQLETWLIINMPYFNKMFESEMITFDPLVNSKTELTYNKTTDKNQTDNRDVTNHNTSNATTTTDTTNDGTENETDTSFNRDLESNTPDSRLTITTDDGSGVIEYASSINENKGTNTQTSDNHSTTHLEDVTDTTSDSTVSDDKITDINETEDFVQSRTGKIGIQTYSKMLQEYRESFIRIENKIFDEMQELFMLVY